MMSDACDGLRSTALIPRVYESKLKFCNSIAVCICLNSIYATIFHVVHLELKLLHNLVVDRAVHLSGVGALQLGLQSNQSTTCTRFAEACTFC